MLTWNRHIYTSVKYILVMSLIICITGCSDSHDIQFESKTFIENADFEQGATQPASWKPVRFYKQGPSPEMKWSNLGRNNSKCLKIACKDKTAAGWAQEVEIDPDGYYQLTGWIKTENIKPSEGGVAIYIQEFRWKRPTIIRVNSDWQQVTFSFHNNGFYKLTMICLLGATNLTSGTVYFDDLELKKRVPYGSDPKVFKKVSSDKFSLTVNRRRGVLTSLKHTGQAESLLDYLPNPDTLPYVNESKDHWLGDTALDLRTDSGADWVRVTTADPGYEKKVKILSNGMETMTTFSGVPGHPELECEVASSMLLNRTGERRETLKWVITLKNKGNKQLEIGSIDLPFPANNNYCLFNPHDKSSQKLLYTRRAAEHKHIGGAGSYIIQVPMKGDPPYLLYFPGNGTQFEFTYHEPDSVADRDRGPDIHGAWPGLTRVCLVSRGVIDRYKWKEWFNGHTTIKLAPGEKKHYEIMGTWLDNRAELQQTLSESNNTGVRVVPGMGVPQGTSATIIVQSSNQSITASGDSDTQLQKHDAANPYHLYSVKFSGEGNRTVSITNGDNRKTNLFFYALPSIAELMDRRARFIVGDQYYSKKGDLLDNAILCYNQYRDSVLADPTDMWGSGGYEGGITDGMFLAMKNVYRPDAEQIKLLETYIHNFIIGKLQNPVNFGVSWTVHRPDRTERGYNYMHVMNLYEAMVHVAETWPSLTEHDAEYYLDLCWKTFNAFLSPDVKYQDLGLMGRGNVTFLPALFRRFNREENANQIEIEIRRWASYWEEGDPYPYGSELFFDNTGYETVFFYCDYAGSKNLAQQTVRVTKAGRGRAPCWFWTDSDQRWWDAVDVVPVYKSFTDFGENCHHYMTGLNGWMLLEAYEKGYDLETGAGLTGYDGILSSWARVHENGFASMCYCPDPASKNYGFNKFSGDVGLGLWGNLKANRAYVVDDSVMGITGYGCEVSSDNKQLTIIPYEGIQNHLRIPESGLKIDLFGPGVDKYVIAKDYSDITMELNNPFPFTASMRSVLTGLKPGQYVVSSNGKNTGTYHIKENKPLEITLSYPAHHKQTLTIKWYGVRS